MIYDFFISLIKLSSSCFCRRVCRNQPLCMLGHGGWFTALLVEMSYSPVSFSDRRAERVQTSREQPCWLWMQLRKGRVRRRRAEQSAACCCLHIFSFKSNLTLFLLRFTLCTCTYTMCLGLLNWTKEQIHFNDKHEDPI